MLIEFPGGEKLSTQEILFCPCDILVPAATENQITAQNARRVECRILCGGTNGPTTADADAVIDQEGILIIPDILSNAGGSRSAISNGYRIVRGFLA